jgi:hypothetical protein
MIKRLLVFAILISMILHCVCRLGLLNHAYKKRHEIAHTLGLIAEMPIAMCSSDHDFGGKLIVEMDEDEGSIPADTTQAREINLYCISAFVLSSQKNSIPVREPINTHCNLYSLTLIDSIFRPPSA